ncbi:MAG TPA: hypothetical protein VGL58_08435 [Caulobacteraceae bacterium]|jgi:hypothetical protein
MKRYDYRDVLATADGHFLAADELFGAHRRMVALQLNTSGDIAFVTRLNALTASAFVLQAIALELGLKARLLKAGVSPGNVHHHRKLFDKLPESDRAVLIEAYNERWVANPVRPLPDALDMSANIFVQWRYRHEHFALTANGGEMRFAFEVVTKALR